MNPMNPQKGFTLVEIMIVVVIVGILAAIALPSYQRYVRRTICQDAQATLVAAASALERYRAQHGSYKAADTDLLTRLGYAQSPVSGAQEFSITSYPRRKVDVVSAGNINCTNNGAQTTTENTSYCLTAYASGRLKDGQGSTLTLDSTGARGGTGKLVGAWENRCSGI